MTLYEYYLVYPEGDIQEISHAVHVSSLVDINGNKLATPLPTNKMLAYYVQRKHTREERGIVQVHYILDQLTADELLDYI